MLYLTLLFPLAGFLILMGSSFFISRRVAGWVACTSIIFPFIVFLGFIGTASFKVELYDWIPLLHTPLSFRLDHLSLLMGLIITGVGALIHIYSIGYMDHERDYARYFACLNFFVFAMLLLVLANNLLVLFVGWEGVGLASYLLIGFWYQRPKAAAAATKAFVMNRIGDLGFLLGLLLIFFLFGTSDMDEISSRAGEVGVPLITLITLLLFFGATGKSAQIPLHTWLPDAMEGPTPVSALIHAATMVTAGVYLVVRMHPLFDQAPITLLVIGVIGAATSLFAALSAVGQSDLKRVLAYSTVSQLGLMFLACGVGAYFAAMFHLTTHAFIKALLFLSAGNIVHMLHGETEMGKMGGLKTYFKKTQWLFLTGVLAMSGIPPLAAFFSKDLILEQVNHHGYTVLFVLGLIVSLLTAFYLTRAFFLTFRGAFQGEEHPEEAPPVMILPLLILAFLSVIGGIFGKQLEEFLQIGDPAISWHMILQPETWLATASALIGVMAGAYWYRKEPWVVLKKAFYVDRLYWDVLVRPLQALSSFISHIFEPKLFEGSMHGAAEAANRGSLLALRIQSGQIRSYMAWMAMGLFLLTLYFVFLF